MKFDHRLVWVRLLLGAKFEIYSGVTIDEELLRGSSFVGWNII